MDQYSALLPVPKQIQRNHGQAIKVPQAGWRLSPDAWKSPAIRSKIAAMRIRGEADRSLKGWAIVVNPPQKAVEPPQWTEGYSLQVGEGGVAIRGRDAKGLFWGLVTLEQAMESGRGLLPVEITDWPAIAVRYHHDDVSRKQISTVEDFKRIIRLLSGWKIGHYTPYMEDVLHIASHPQVGEGRGKLMPEEVQDLVQYAQHWNVELFPTFSLVGHQENLLKHPGYAHLGRKVFQPASSLDVTRPEVRKFLQEEIAAVCAMFPSGLFHMGFDETQGLGEKEFIEHANWCAEQLAKHGKRPLMWVDMIYNHFGYKAIRKLHPAIIPVNWQYSSDDGKVKHQRELEKEGRPIWGLAAYQSTCTFLPDQHGSRPVYQAWAKALSDDGKRPWTDVGLGSSVWGDDGYENSRELIHSQIAAFAEYAWSGAQSEPQTVETRFNQHFYGQPLPEMERFTHRLPTQLSVSCGRLWRLHRARATELRRRLIAGEYTIAAMQNDIVWIDAALKDLAKLKPARNREHLAHYRAALLRNRSVLQRMASVIVWPPVRAAKQVLAGLEEARREYVKAWMQNNRPENIEVSLAVFTRVQAEWEALGKRQERIDFGPYRPIDLTKRFSLLHLDAGGLPLGMEVCNGVPFAFAPEKHTHLELMPKKPRLVLPMDALPVRDLHLVLTGPRGDGSVRPALRVTLLHEGRDVFREDLLRVRHICDWWAPYGNHMWAGGGLAYTDPMRVRPAVWAAEYFAMMEIFRFGLAGAPMADAVSLEVIDDQPVQIFAITVEEAIRK